MDHHILSLVYGNNPTGWTILISSQFPLPSRGIILLFDSSQRPESSSQGADLV